MNKHAPRKTGRWRQSPRRSNTRRRWRPRHHSKRDRIILPRRRTRIRIVRVDVQAPHVHVTPGPPVSIRLYPWQVHTFDGRGKWQATHYAKTKEEAQRIARRTRLALKRQP